MSRLETLKSMLSERPEDTFLLYAISMEYVKSEDFSTAVACFDQLLVVDPQYVAAYFQKAQALTKDGQEDVAASVLKVGIEIARQVGDEHARGEMIAFLDMIS